MAALRKQEQDEALDPVLGSDEDRDLTLSFQRGEQHAYGSIYSRYHRSVYNVCYRMLGQRDDAQEATQETFLRVYQALGRFNGHYQLGPWIVRIATNVCLDHLRLRKRRPQDVTSIDALEQRPGAGTDDPEQVLLKRAEGDKVRAVLSSLPPAHRAAIVLRDYEGLPYREIALTLGISEGQVKALLHRARKRFRRTWVPAPIMLPLYGFLNRFRGRQLPLGPAEVARAASPAAEIAYASGSVASSGLLEHVSVALGDKVAPVIAAAIIGASAVGGAVAVRESSEPPVVGETAGTNAATHRDLEGNSAASHRGAGGEATGGGATADKGSDSASGEQTKAKSGVSPATDGNAAGGASGDTDGDEPGPTSGVVPTPTPMPSPSPDPSPTPEPTPSPTPSPDPSPTPEPTPSPTPTPSPDPSPTPEPTATPTPEPTATPTLTPPAPTDTDASPLGTAPPRGL